MRGDSTSLIAPHESHFALTALNGSTKAEFRREAHAVIAELEACAWGSSSMIAPIVLTRNSKRRRPASGSSVTPLTLRRDGDGDALCIERRGKGTAPMQVNVVAMKARRLQGGRAQASADKRRRASMVLADYGGNDIELNDDPGALFRGCA